jgi:NAD(P)-dependent dehydrogenase (short-subunit alcohol dehydrogenase family)
VSGVEKRVVVVTGAGRGLGRAYALYLAESGARVVVNDIGTGLTGEGSDDSVAEQVVKEITSAGGEAVASTDSVADAEGGARIVQRALDAYGRIDGVVNNAGIIRDVSFAKMELEQFEAVMQTHLFGAYHVTRAAWPHFREQSHGRVVVATSSTGLFGNFGQANYGAAKLGLVGLIHTLAIEGKKYNILANAVSPMGATRMTANVQLDNVQTEKLDPSRVAPAVAYLCSDECQDSGIIVRAGGGHYSRVAFMQSVGMTLPEQPTLGQFADVWPDIMRMDNAKLGGGVGQF